MFQRRDEDQALAVRQRGTREPADGAVEKVLVLVKLDDMLAGRGIGNDVMPRLAVAMVSTVAMGIVKLTVHRCRPVQSSDRASRQVRLPNYKVQVPDVQTANRSEA